jgi:hypothetical protein
MPPLSRAVAAAIVFSALSAAMPATQPDAFSSVLLQHRFALSVRAGQLSGTGAPVLRSAVADSRFVLLGEEHGLPQTPQLWTAICRAARNPGFDALAVEEGPFAAADLERWARRPDGAAQLAAFEKQYPESLNIYGDRSEFDALRACLDEGGAGTQLWGLNQEAPGAASPMLARILTMTLGPLSRTAIQRLKAKGAAVTDGDLADAAAALRQDGSHDAQALFDSLIESHTINKTSPADPANARRRERLMQRLFTADYDRATHPSAPLPRVLVKLGAFHVYRDVNPAGGHGLGEYLAGLAARQGGHSIHIELTRERDLPIVLDHLVSGAWTLFDLRPLRPRLNTLPGPRQTELSTLIRGIDLLLVVPRGTP